MTLPQITAIGNIVTDPQMRFTPQGIALLEFRMACNERKKDDSGKWVDGRSTFLGVTLWRNVAEQAGAELSKGQEVIVTGRLIVEEYEKDGQTRQAVKIDVDTIGVTFGRRQANVKITEVSDEIPF